ncbi:MAG: hypothetical protein AAGD01_03165 [Acidobacteriota bacterium]
MIRIRTLLRPVLWFLYLMLAFEVVLAVLPLAVRFIDSLREPEPPRRHLPPA